MKLEPFLSMIAIYREEFVLLFQGFFGLQSPLLLFKIRSPWDIYFGKASCQLGKGRDCDLLSCIRIFDGDGLVLIREIADNAFVSMSKGHSKRTSYAGDWTMWTCK